ncbi:hypothetical protein [Robertmurraya massiliosenegalensis]|uniref:hypothetical protein n=1 Tax=Robertmurraya massiliosenegalensis TaxID=1287657 RepID=UPI0011DDB74D|nr:hypothetical protein [Robertmurraya massiliosenegalensis]
MVDSRRAPKMNRCIGMSEHLCENDRHSYYYNLFAEQAGFFLEMENKGWRSNKSFVKYDD